MNVVKNLYIFQWNSSLEETSSTLLINSLSYSLNDAHKSYIFQWNSSLAETSSTFLINSPTCFHKFAQRYFSGTHL